jgi:hypothetical protein
VRATPECGALGRLLFQVDAVDGDDAGLVTASPGKVRKGVDGRTVENLTVEAELRSMAGAKKPFPSVVETVRTAEMRACDRKCV